MIHYGTELLMLVPVEVVIGSAAGVVAMGMEKLISCGILKDSFLVIGYISGFMTFILLKFCSYLMNYTEAIDWREHSNIIRSNYDGYELKLVNIAKFASVRKSPNDLGSIHVGGTNGKGSTYISYHQFYKTDLMWGFSSPYMYDLGRE